MNMQSVERKRHQPASAEDGSLGGRFLGFIQAEVMLLPVDHYLSDPFLLVAAPRHAPIFRGTPLVGGCVLHLFGTTRYETEVAAPVVEPIVIAMVNFDHIGASQPENLAVHDERPLFPVDSQRTIGISVHGEYPTPLRCPVGIFSVHQCLCHYDPVPSEDRDLRDAVLNQNRQTRLGGLAAVGTPVLRANPRRCSRDRNTAARTGKMYGHRSLPLRRNCGVSPRPSQAVRGRLLPSNYTPYQIGGAA